MKNYLIAALTAITMIGTVGAQHFNLGVKGGANLYNIKYGNGTRHDSKVGFHAGLLGHFHMSKHFGLQPEVYYSNQGARHTFNNRVTTLNLNYVNVPVLFQYMINDGFRLHAGPQIGFLVNSETKHNDINVYQNKNINFLDFGITLGMSYVFKSNFGIDARYNHGLRDIYNNSSVNSSNRGFQLGLFYLFSHKS
ncbi:MAG: PorT family protein [Bacteroidetes bacterium]|nr:PorT family protein [Bacteroidota bacterium]HET6244881.1 porin family protein [Bacteroidia bacterium]